MLLDIKSGALTISFPAEAGGLPGKIVVAESDGRETVLFDNRGWALEVELENGHVLHPVATGENLNVTNDKYGTYVNFFNVHFADESGKDYPLYYLTLRHEFYPDGTAFTNMFFFVRDINTPGIVRFELSARPDFSAFDNVRWSARMRPESADGTMITAPSERFLEPGTPRNFAQTLPLAGFNATRKFAPSLYAEFFIEGQCALSNRPEDTETSVTWQGNSPELRWNFQKGAFPGPLVNQLRNQWGWTIRPAQKSRHLPPLKLYHYFDNYLRYPSDETIAALIEAKCDVLIMHENWRSDAQNDGCPFELDSFIKLRDALHAANIRIAVYVRGNEESVVMRHAEWFRHLLQYDFDGLYMDYGGPFHRITPADESYCGGRLLFREHYLNMRRIRETIGDDGLFFNHTGPSYSAVGQNFATGYVSGEGERGMLIRSREEYEYFSMAPVTSGTLWAAAFPEYSSPLIVPFLASAGQSPHCNLGEQFNSCSLVHPRVPGISDHAFDKLWRLWSIIRKEKDLTVINDYNSSEVFAKDSISGHCLFITETGNFALLILSNFSETARTVSTEVNLARAGFTRNTYNITLLQNNSAVTLDKIPDNVTIGGNGVAGLLLSAPELPVSELLDIYSRSTPELSAIGQSYLHRVAEQRELRANPPSWPEIWMQILIPELPPTPYEDSMILDLFNNAFELGEVDENGKFEHICFIDRNGKAASDSPAKRIFAGQSSPAIKLNNLGLKGLRHLAVKSTHDGIPFYSFCFLKFTPSPESGTEGYQLEFLNDLEPDRAFLNFYCNFN